MIKTDSERIESFKMCVCKKCGHQTLDDCYMMRCPCCNAEHNPPIQGWGRENVFLKTKETREN